MVKTYKLDPVVFLNKFITTQSKKSRIFRKLLKFEAQKEKIEGNKGLKWPI